MKNIKKIIFITFAGSIGILLIMGLVAFFMAPVILKSSILRQFKQVGLDDISIGRIEVGLSAVRIFDIVLDANQDSRIGYLAGTYSLEQLLKGRLDRVVIDKTRVTFETLKQIQKNLVDQTVPSNGNTITLPFKALDIKNALISMVYPTVGEVKLKFKGDVFSDTEYVYKLQGQYNIDQAIMKVQGRLTGQLNTQLGAYELLVDIDKAKALQQHLTLKRVIGWINVKQEAGPAQRSTTAELNIGRMKVKGMPLKGITITYNDTDNKKELLANGSAPNQAGHFALSVNMQDQEKLGAPVLSGKLDVIAEDLKRLNELSDDWSIGTKFGGSGYLKTNFSLRTRAENNPQTNAVLPWEIETASIFALDKFTLGGNLHEFSTAGKVTYNNKNQNFNGELLQQTKFNYKDLGITIPFHANKTTKFNYSLLKQIVNVELESFELNNNNNKLKNNGLISLLYNIHEAELSLTANNSQVEYRNDTMEGKLITGFDLNWDMEHSVPVGNITAKNIEVLEPKGVISPLYGRLNIRGEAQANNAIFQGYLSDENGVFSTTVKGHHNFETQKGLLNIDFAEVNFDDNILKLTEIFPISSQYFSNVTGTLASRAKLNWFLGGEDDNTLQIQGDAQILFKDISGEFGEFAISKVNSVFAFEQLFPLRFKNQEISIAAMSLGLPLTGGLLRVSYDAPKNKLFTLHKAEWQMAQGQVNLQPFRTHLDHKQFDIVLAADKLDLQTIFQSTNLDGIQASGSVSGKVPITIFTDGRYQIENGLLETSEKGYFKYSPNQMPDFLRNPKSQNLLFLKQALNNFEYDSLKLGIQSSSEEGQSINLNAKGKNPDFYDGFPVDINLKLEGNVQNVFKYSLSTYKIPDTIKENIERYENARKKEN